MKLTLLPLAGLLSTLALAATSAHAQLSVAGGTLAVLSGTTLSVGGPVSVSAGATFDNQGTVQLTGDLTSAGTLSSTGGTGQWQLTGAAAAQQVAVGALLPALDVQNPQGATLGAALRVRQLQLSGGPVRLGAYVLTSTLGGSIGGVSGPAGRFVITDGAGALEQYVGTGGTLFPVGPTAARYAPAALTRSTGPADLYQVSAAADALRQGNAGAPYATAAVALRWNVAPPDAVPYALAVQWQAADELPGFNRAASALARWTGSAYAPAAFGPASGANPYQQTSAGLTAAGPFVVLDQQAPLPVELIRFDARRPSGQPQVLLSWATASEKNSAGFEVQRQDEGQSTFRRVGFVAGAGSSAAPRSYTFTDPNAFVGLSYYRLRQVDADGTATFSPVRAVSGLPAGTAFSLSAYPNPVALGASLTLEAAGPLPSALSLALYAADGRLVRQLSWPAGAATLAVPTTGLAEGAYWLRYQSADGPHGTLPVVVGQ